MSETIPVWCAMVVAFASLVYGFRWGYDKAQRDQIRKEHRELIAEYERRLLRHEAAQTGSEKGQG